MNVLAAAAANGGASAGQVILGVAALAAGILAYWLPSLVAWRRHAPSVGSVVVVNLFLGWTVIGWIVALVMAMRDPVTAPQVTITGQ